MIPAAIRRNPFPLFALLRRVAPVLHDRKRGFWIVFDFETGRRVVGDYAAFSSHAAPPGGKPLDWLIFQDPPIHSKLRALVMPAFTPRAIEALAPGIEARADALIDERIATGTMDLVADFADRLPLLVIGDILGIPPQHEPMFRRWSNAIIHLTDAILGGETAERVYRDFRAAKEEMRPYVANLVAERRTSPRDDLLSRLSHLPDADIFNFFQLLLAAGIETTTNLIANAVICLVRNPKQLALVRANRELVPQAIEEVLRYRSPAQLIPRVTRQDVILRGRTIPAGQLVIAVLGAANRDPKQFPNAARFDVTRRPNDHIAFGHGAHYCIGATLARLEARIALTCILDRLESLRLVTTKWAPRSAINVHGPESLPLRFTARR